MSKDQIQILITKLKNIPNKNESGKNSKNLRRAPSKKFSYKMKTSPVSEKPLLQKLYSDNRKNFSNKKQSTSMNDITIIDSDEEIVWTDKVVKKKEEAIKNEDKQTKEEEDDSPKTPKTCSVDNLDQFTFKSKSKSKTPT